jgi:hypothetical protein
VADGRLVFATQGPSTAQPPAAQPPAENDKPGPPAQ